MTGIGRKKARDAVRATPAPQPSSRRHIPPDSEPSPSPVPTMVRCEICLAAFPKGERGLKSHVGRVHQEISWLGYHAQYVAPKATAIEQALGIAIEPGLLRHALTHRSYAYENGGLPTNERLEFLGDSVLGLVMTEFLYNFFQHSNEGDLTQIKSVVVSTSVLARESERLALDQYYSVGKGVIRKRKLPVSLLANVFEAVVAAIYKDAGLEPARRFVIRNLYHQVLAVAENRHRRNYKSILQQWAQKELNVTPTYRVVGEKGPDHFKSFEVVAMVGKKRYRSGQGRSKKEAEQIAARETLKALLQEKGAPESSAEDAAALFDPPSP
jgi:ribonuclease III